VLWRLLRFSNFSKSAFLRDVKFRFVPAEQIIREKPLSSPDVPRSDGLEEKISFDSNIRALSLSM
jgi:hypothetical protein